MTWLRFAPRAKCTWASTNRFISASTRSDVAKRGLAGHFAGHVNRLHALTGSLGLRMGMWADMLYFLPDAVPLLPADIMAYEWYYYPFTRKPRVEFFNFAESDLGDRLRARGIEYWGCPMNGAFRFEPMPNFSDRLANIASWWRHCRKTNAAGFLVTSWEPNRLAMELATAIDAATAGLWLEPKTTDPLALLSGGFARVFGGDGRRAAKAALGCDRFPFGGYPRWEINARWDVVSKREPLRSYRMEEQFFRRLSRAGKRKRAFPGALQASIELRHYLAVRDVCVREAARGRAGALRPCAAALKDARRAARAMWTVSRDAKALGPNDRILEADAQRLKNPSVWSGTWQLCYRVANFAPAAQLVGIEQKQVDGKWRELQACHTIEFQAAAARRRGGFTREHAAPIEWNGDPRAFPVLRLVLRGLGQVRIEDVALTDGRRSWPLSRGKKTLGQPAPISGWPDLDWTKVQDAWELKFAVRTEFRNSR
jgi:hypothetical protein